MNYCVYLLCHSENNCTYVGITNNLNRRCRQHNGEIKGGARYTTMKKGSGLWKVHSTIQDLTKSMALSIEKKIHLKTKKTKGSKPIDRRLSCIQEILKDYQDKQLVSNN
jgi:predicted GIY-YIG superfamily endonuclease